MFAHSLLTAVLWGGVFGVMIAGMRWLLNRGGAPTQQGEALVYRPRPGARIVGSIVLGMGLLLWGCAVVAMTAKNWQQAMFEVGVGLPLVWLGAFGIMQSLTMAGDALRYHRWLMKPVVIPWEDLSHYEVNSSALVSILLLRSRAGRPTIALSNLAYHVNDIIAKATSKTVIREQPFRRQRWYRA